MTEVEKDMVTGMLIGRVAILPGMAPKGATAITFACMDLAKKMLEAVSEDGRWASCPACQADFAMPTDPAATIPESQDDHFTDPLTVELTTRWLADGAEHYADDALQSALFRRAERVVRALFASLPLPPESHPSTR